MGKYDLRNAIAKAKSHDDLLETHKEVDASAQLAGIYRYIGAYGTVQRPTKSLHWWISYKPYIRDAN